MMVRILVVEDDEQLRNLVTTVLQSQDYEVMTAENGAAATRILENNHIDLIITDIIMPEKDGMGLIREIRRDHPDIQIIAVSGGARHIDPQNPLHIAKKLGVQLTLTKPFKLDELLGAVRELV